MQICGKLHGFSISTVLCSFLSERECRTLHFEGDEHEGNKKNKGFIAPDGEGWVFVPDALCQSGAGRQRLRPDAGPARNATRGSARVASGESPHGADGVT